MCTMASSNIKEFGYGNLAISSPLFISFNSVRQFDKKSLSSNRILRTPLSPLLDDISTTSQIEEDIEAVTSSCENLN